MVKVAVILAAAGRGERVGTEIPKQFLEILGTPVFVYALSVFEAHPKVSEIVIAVPPGWEEEVAFATKRRRFRKVAKVVSGGATRQASVRRALENLSSEAELVLVHDAARPLISEALVSRLLEAIEREGAALCAIPVRDTVKLVRSGRVERTVPREGLWLAQTPQGARRSWLEEAYRRAGDREFTDEAALLEAAGFPVCVVPGDPLNLKITYPEDLKLAEALLTLDIRKNLWGYLKDNPGKGGGL